MSLALVRYEPPPTKVLARRMLLLAELRESLEQLEADRDKLKHQLREFEKRFRPAVGDRYDQLEELREQIRSAGAKSTGPETGPSSQPTNHFRTKCRKRRLSLKTS